MVIYLGALNKKMDREMAHESAKGPQEKAGSGGHDEHAPQKFRYVL